MDFKSIPSEAYPAYTWLWNGRVTREGIKREIEEMYASGIRAFYILGEPENFCPHARRTHLEPEYMSDEFLDLVYYAFEVANEKGMHMWLYNEGGFPSGMVCGKVREIEPECAFQYLKSRTRTVQSGEVYQNPDDIIGAYVNRKQINDGDILSGGEIYEYYLEVGTDDISRLRTDIVNPKTTELFLKLTHEKYLSRFGEHLGRDITFMFDDEAVYSGWTRGFEKIFYEKYGYDILPYLPIISYEFAPENDKEERVYSDYIMLCGELTRDNYFLTMRKWLNEHKMKSVGHLDRDNFSQTPEQKRYGNIMSMLRAFDVPGIDVIMNQISYPADGKSIYEGYAFFPRIASSAARQQGHSLCLSESFAVSGSQVTPEEMRYVVNYQAVRGISRFNFMVISYDRDSVMACQYRPDFASEYPGMDMLKEINDYTARLSYLLENSRSDVRTALYYPCRSIAARGNDEAKLLEEFEELGNMLERAGVDFDIIDEELVQGGEICDGKLVCEHVSYDNVFSPAGRFEPQDVKIKLVSLSCELCPTVERKNPCILARRVILDNAEAVLVCNTSNEAVCEEITFEACGNIYKLDLYDGGLYETEHIKSGGKVTVKPELLRGELAVYVITKDTADTQKTPQITKTVTVHDISAVVKRRFGFDDTKIVNTYHANGIIIEPFKPWEKDFSGEVMYKFTVPEGICGRVVLDLGEVRHFARIFVNGEKRAEKTMPPYTVALGCVSSGDTIEILVANTGANALANTDFFDKLDIRDVGPYNKKMREYEKKALAGGLLGPVNIHITKQNNVDL